MKDILKHSIRWLRAVLIYYSGLYFVLTTLRRFWSGRHSFMILRYHRVQPNALCDPFHLSVSPEVFDKQLEYLKNHYQVCSMEECLKMGDGEWGKGKEDKIKELKGNKTKARMDQGISRVSFPVSRAPLLAITFDDGYLDNYTEAFPLLQKHQVPALIFATSGLIGTDQKFWWDEMRGIVEGARETKVRLSYAGATGRRQEKYILLRGKAEKLKAIQELEILGNQLEEAEKQNLMRQLKEQCGDHASSERLVMNREELVDLSNHDIEIGAHGCHHVLLTKVDQKEAIREIEQSKKDLEAILDKKVRFFAYPGGQVATWMEQSVRASGFQASFLTTPGENNADTSPYQLRRRAIHEKISTNPWGGFSKAVFACAVEGIGMMAKRLPVETGKIRILYVIDKLTYAGSQKHLYELVNALDRERFEIKVICLERGGPLEASFQTAGIPYEVIGISNWNSMAGIRGLIRLIALTKAYQPDVVHAYLFTSNVFAPIAAKIAGVRLVITSRRDLGDWESKRQIGLNRFANHFVDFVTANSEAVRAAAMNLEAIPIEKTQVIYNGIRVDPFQFPRDKTVLKARWGFPAKSTVIGTLSNIRREKDPMTLLRAYLQISQMHPQVFLAYGGRVKDQALWSEIQSFIKTHELENRVRFVGAVENAPDFLGALDLFVFPSMSEGFSNSILEAMAAGLPVVASDVGGNQEQVLSGVTGYLFAVGNVAECVLAVDKLLSQGQSEMFGKGARQRILERYTHDRMAFEMTALYEKLLAKKRPSNRGCADQQEKGVEDETVCKVS